MKVCKLGNFSEVEQLELIDRVFTQCSMFLDPNSYFIKDDSDQILMIINLSENPIRNHSKYEILERRFLPQEHLSKVKNYMMTNWCYVNGLDDTDMLNALWSMQLFLTNGTPPTSRDIVWIDNLVDDYFISLNYDFNVSISAETPFTKWMLRQMKKIDVKE